MGVSAESAPPLLLPSCTCVRSKIRRFCCGLNFDLFCSAADERVRPAVAQLHIIIAMDCRRWECTWPHTLPVGTVPSRLPAQREKATRAWTSLDGIAGGPEWQMALLTDWQVKQWRERTSYNHWNKGTRRSLWQACREIIRQSTVSVGLLVGHHGARSVYLDL